MQTHDEDRLLRSATQWQKKPSLRCVQAGEEARLFLQRRQRDCLKNAALAQTWDELIPPGLKPWCRLDQRTGNVLTVQAMPGPYLHQLMMAQQELLEALRRRCPACGVQKLRIVPWKDDNEDR